MDEICADAPGNDRPIVLIGFMGSGKSSVARHLSRMLKIPFSDLDTEMEKRAGCSVATYFSAHGEEAFRELETALLRESLSKSLVLATGGGIVKSLENRDALLTAATAGALVVYLRASPEVLAARIRRQPGSRPLIDGERNLNYEETVVRVRMLLTERAGYYEACANYTLPADELSTAKIAGMIAEKMAGFEQGVQ